MGYEWPVEHLFEDLDERERWDYLKYVDAWNPTYAAFVRSLMEGRYTITQLASANGYDLGTFGSIIRLAWDGFKEERLHAGLPVIGECPHELPPLKRSMKARKKKSGKQRKQIPARAALAGVRESQDYPPVT